MNRITSFFEKINQYLIRNYPWIWSIRLHQLLPITVIVYLAVFGLIFSQNPERYHRQDEVIISWLYVVSAAGMVLWLVYFFRFNPLKSFGKRPWGDEYLNLLLVFTGVMLLVMLPFTYYPAKHARVHSRFTQAELTSAANQINLGLALGKKLSDDSTQLKPKEDSAHYWKILQHGNAEYNYCDTFFLDSDSVIHCYNLGHFRELDPYYVSYTDVPESGMTGLWSPRQLYYQCLKIRTAEDTARVYRQLIEGMNRFTPWDVSLSQLQAMTRGGVPLEEAVGSYQGEYLDFFNLMDEKLDIARQNFKYFNIYGWQEWDEILHVMFYVIFYMTLLILIFRNMTVKTFLISAGGGAAIPVLFALIVIATGHMEDLAVFVLAFVLYAAGWMLFAISGTFTRRTLLRGMLLNWLTVTTPLLGIFLAAWWVEYYQKTVYWEDQDAELTALVLFYGEVGGLLLFLFMLQPLFKKWYVKWYSLPEQ